MCRNHSHMTGKLIGTVVIADTPHLIFENTQDFTVEIPNGGTWKRPAGNILLIPVLNGEDWSVFLSLLTVEHSASMLPSDATTPKLTDTTPDK